MLLSCVNQLYTSYSKPQHVMMTVHICILYLLDNAIYRHQLISLNTRIYIRMNYFVQVNLSKKRNRIRYQRKIQLAYTLFMVHLPYSINKEIISHVLYHPLHQHSNMWLMNMRQKISSRVSTLE